MVDVIRMFGLKDIHTYYVLSLLSLIKTLNTDVYDYCCMSTLFLCLNGNEGGQKQLSAIAFN